MKISISTQADHDRVFDQLWQESLARQRLAELIEVESDPEVAAAAREYVVIKKSTGEVVAAFDYAEDAEAMIERAKKQKKAALMVLETGA